MSTVRLISELECNQRGSQHAPDSLEFAQQLDSEDAFAQLRNEFEIPGSTEKEIYFCGHALGAMPRAVPQLIGEELESWRETGAPGHSYLKNPDGKPWTAGHASGGVDERYTDVMADLIGALPSEVAWMGGLTSNLHSLLSTFYRPQKSGRYKILYEANAFPSDRFAFHSQVQLAGLDPADALLGVTPRAGEDILRTSDILDIVSREGQSIALVCFGAVHWGTGQWLDMQTITKAAHEAGCIVGWDCAHAAGNVPMKLHEWDVDFAVWCTYKYLFSGPGATAGIFVNEKHFDLPRQSGWWGHEIDTRFVYAPGFKARTGAAGFAVSNPSVLGTVPVHASMQVFETAARLAEVPRSVVIDHLRDKSILLTGHLENLLSQANCESGNSLSLKFLSPTLAKERGSCLCFTVSDPRSVTPVDQSQYSPALKAFCKVLADRGVIVDKRAPDLVRLSPCAVYNTFEEVWHLVQAAKGALR